MRLKRYWLMKSEPSEVSIDDAVEQKVIAWFGVRNYQARNFMRDEMQVGDLALFWHSSCKEPGIYGVVKIVSSPHPDSHQFDPGSGYFDATSTTDKPRWWCVDVQLLAKTKYIPINQLRTYPELEKMQVLQKGNRLSITKVSSKEWEFVQKILTK